MKSLIFAVLLAIPCAHADTNHDAVVALNRALPTRTDGKLLVNGKVSSADCHLKEVHYFFQTDFSRSLATTSELSDYEASAKHVLTGGSDILHSPEFSFFPDEEYRKMGFVSDYSPASKIMASITEKSVSVATQYNKIEIQKTRTGKTRITIIEGTKRTCEF